MRLEQFVYIIAVNQYGSLSKAATHLYLSHPALSMAITNLERELGFKIFQRSSTGVRPTPNGMAVIDKAEEIVRAVDEIKRMALNTETFSSKTITLTSISTTTNNILIKVISKFNKLHPDCQINIDEQPLPLVLAALVNGSCDIAVSYFEQSKLGWFEDYCKENRIYWEIVFYDFLVPFVRKDHPLTRKTKVTEEDIKGYRTASTTHRTDIKNKGLYNNPLDSNASVSFRNLEGLKLLISESDTVAYLPHFFIHNDYFAKSGAIVPLDVAEPKLKLFHYIAHLTDQPLSMEAACLFDEIKRSYQSIKTADAGKDSE